MGTDPVPALFTMKRSSVGSLVYGASHMSFSFDDRVLAHLQLLIAAKLRRGESFMLSWHDDPAVGNGRSSIWLDPGIPLYFQYSGSRHPVINKEWLEDMAIAAASSNGLVIGEEPGAHMQGVRATDNSVKRKDHPAS